MILKIVNMTDFDIRTFMWIQLSQNKDLTFDNLYLYHILSAVVLQEISKERTLNLDQYLAIKVGKVQVLSFHLWMKTDCIIGGRIRMDCLRGGFGKFIT
jgi:hypothetical protein